MKKMYVLTVTIIYLLILFVGSAYYMQLFEVYKIKNFDLSEPEYEYIISNVSSKIVFGYTGSAREARKNAEKVWIEIYGDRVKKQKPYIVEFDEANQVWLVYGTLHGINMFGGTAGMLIQKYDGKVLAVWHGK